MEPTESSGIKSIQNGAIIGPLKSVKFSEKDLDQYDEKGLRNEMSPLVDTCTHRQR